MFYFLSLDTRVEMRYNRRELKITTRQAHTYADKISKIEKTSVSERTVREVLFSLHKHNTAQL